MTYGLWLLRYINKRSDPEEGQWLQPNGTVCIHLAGAQLYNALEWRKPQRATRQSRRKSLHIAAIYPGPVWLSNRHKTTISPHIKHSAVWVGTQSKAAAGLTRDQPGQLAWFVHNAFIVSTLYVREQAAINDFYFLIKAAENNVFFRLF